jgi:hypothetical protein
MFVEVEWKREKYREYTRNRKGEREKMRHLARTVAWGHSGGDRTGVRRKEMACRPQSPSRFTP